jgi:glycosyltransferase involved in cell wall biosynthesis
LNKLLIIVDWFYPGFKGGGPIISITNLVKLLHSNFEIFILTGDRDLGDSIPYPGIQHSVWLPYQKIAKIMYIEKSHVGIRFYWKIIKSIEPNVIYFNSIYSWPFSILPLIAFRFYKGGVYLRKSILAPRGMLQEGALAQKKLKKQVYNFLFRQSGIPDRIKFHATDSIEEKDIRMVFPKSSGISLIEVASSSSTRNYKPVLKIPNELKAIFLSRISPKKNLDYLLLLLREFPLNLRLSIYGHAEDSLYLAHCKNIAAQVSTNVCISWHEAIPNNLVLATLEEYHLFILPTKGENFGHAIFESFQAGRPVLISDKTPWRNLKERKVGMDIDLEKPHLFKQELLKFVQMDQDTYDEWSIAAFSYGQEKQKMEGELKNRYLSMFRNAAQSA